MIFAKKIDSKKRTAVIATIPTTISLINKLKTFGLSPEDWVVEKLDSKYIITHQENQDFKFVGYSTDDCNDWRSIHLYSL